MTLATIEKAEKYRPEVTAVILECSYCTVKNYLAQGLLEPFRVGGKLFVTHASIQKMLDGKAGK